MPIVKICQNQPTLAVRITTPGCNGGQLVDYKHVRLVISAPERTTHEPLLSPQCFKGCWFGHDLKKWEDSFIPPDQLPLLIYPAFGTNDDGDIVFILDSQLWKRVGRYVGSVEFNDGRKILELDLDICTTQFIADKISTDNIPCRG